MKSLIVTFTATNTTGEEDKFLTAEIDVISYTSKDEVLQQILEENEIEENTEDWELTDDFETKEDIHSNYQNTDDIFEYAEAYENSSYDLDVINAAIDCDVNLSDIDEAYNGQYDDDEDFAQQIAEEMGSLDKNAGWPNNCIDWEWAARELMYDYSDSNGHYFRNL